MNSYQGHVAMVGQFFSMTTFKYAAQKAMVFREG